MMNNDNKQQDGLLISALGQTGVGLGGEVSGRHIAAVIFDFDGTLGDTRSLIVRTMQQTIAELGLPKRTDDECAAMIGLPLKRTFTELIPMTDEMGDRCAEVYSRLFDINNVPGAVPLFPHVAETIAALHARGLTLTVASSRHRSSLVAYLDALQLAPYISYVLGADDVKEAKPAPDMVIKTLKDNNLQPDDVVVVGDTVFDIRMAHNAGVKAVGVTYGNGSREDLLAEGAEWVIDDFGELM